MHFKGHKHQKKLKHLGLPADPEPINNTEGMWLIKFVIYSSIFFLKIMFHNLNVILRCIAGLLNTNVFF